MWPRPRASLSGQCTDKEVVNQRRGSRYPYCTDNETLVHWSLFRWPEHYTTDESLQGGVLFSRHHLSLLATVTGQTKTYNYWRRKIETQEELQLETYIIIKKSTVHGMIKTLTINIYIASLEEISFWITAIEFLANKNRHASSKKAGSLWKSLFFGMS